MIWAADVPAFILHAPPSSRSRTGFCHKRPPREQLVTSHTSRQQTADQQYQRGWLRSRNRGSAGTQDHRVASAGTRPRAAAGHHRFVTESVEKGRAIDLM